MNINLEWTEFWYSGNTKVLSEYRRLSDEKSAQQPPKPPKKKIRKRRRVRRRTARRKHQLRVF